MWDGRISASVEAHPCPVSPRPCRKMKVDVCWPLGEIVTVVLGEAAMLAGAVESGGDDDDEIEDEHDVEACLIFLDKESPIRKTRDKNKDCQRMNGFLLLSS